MAASIRDLADEASFIFEGTLRRTGAVTSSALQPAADMAVVHISRILKGPPALASFSGQEITVQLRQPSPSEQSRSFTFFTTGLHFGDGLAVREVGRIDASGTEVEREVREAEHGKQNELLLRRLRDAEIVVAGVAIRTAAYQPPDATHRHVSEHDPDWWECVIRVRDMVKGEIRPVGRRRAAATEVVTLFAHSTDIVWYQSPKFTEGIEGIWLLHRTDFRGNPVPAPVTDHPLDFHPLSELGRIRALVERLQH
jgi:hypothetical protein